MFHTVSATVCLFALLPVLALAAPISGILEIQGTLAFGPGTVDWQPAGGGSGDFLITGNSTGSFAPLAGTTGTIGDIDFSIYPAGTPFDRPGFLMFSADPNLSFALNYIDLGVFTPADCLTLPAAVGQTCTLPGSAINFENSAIGASANFLLRGGVFDSGHPGSVSVYAGKVETFLAGHSYQTWFATINRGGTVVVPYKAGFVVNPHETAVPEPATLAVLAAGLLLIGVQVRRRLG